MKLNSIAVGVIHPYLAYEDLKKCIRSKLVVLHDGRIDQAKMIFENRQEYLGTIEALKSKVRYEIRSSDNFVEFAFSHETMLPDLLTLKRAIENVVIGFVLRKRKK